MMLSTLLFNLVYNDNGSIMVHVFKQNYNVMYVLILVCKNLRLSPYGDVRRMRRDN